MTFPIPPTALSGLRALLIVIPRESPRDTAFFVGTAECDGSSIGLMGPHGRIVEAIAAPAEALRGFDPKVLPKVLMPDAYQSVASLLAGVDACVAVFAGAPPGGLTHADAFFGLAAGAAGEPLLMQGDPRWVSH